MLRLGLPLLVTLLSTHAFGQTPSQAGSRRIVVVPAVKFVTAGIPKTVHEKERFRSMFKREMLNNGWTAVDASSDVDPLPSTAQAAGTNYALRMTGEGNLQNGYTVALELYSAATGKTSSTTAYCDICNTDRFATLAARFALSLIVASQKEEDSMRQAPPEPPAVVAAPPTPTFEPRRDIVSQPSVQPSKGTSWIPWTMVGVGAIGMAYGGWAWHKNANSSGTSYSGSPTTYGHDTYSSNTRGISALAVGGALFVTGAIWIGSSLVSASASPNHVALTLRF